MTRPDCGDCKTLVELLVGAEPDEAPCPHGEHAFVQRCYGMRCMWCPRTIAGPGQCAERRGELETPVLIEHGFGNRPMQEVGTTWVATRSTGTTFSRTRRFRLPSLSPRRATKTMTDQPAPGERRRSLARLVKRDFPERAAASQWCGKHDKARTRLFLRRTYVCLDCVRERSSEA
jgi:hypothetical protein